MCSLPSMAGRLPILEAFIPVRILSGASSGRRGTEARGLGTARRDDARPSAHAPPARTVPETVDMYVSAVAGNGWEGAVP